MKYLSEKEKRTKQLEALIEDQDKDTDPETEKPVSTHHIAIENIYDYITHSTINQQSFHPEMWTTSSHTFYLNNQTRMLYAQILHNIHEHYTNITHQPHVVTPTCHGTTYI